MSVSLTISNLDDETFRRLQAEVQCARDLIQSPSLNPYWPAAFRLLRLGLVVNPKDHRITIWTFWPAPGQKKRLDSSMKQLPTAGALIRKCGSDSNTFGHKCLQCL